MAKKQQLDPEAARLWDRLSERHPDYPESRRASILSAYRGYREEFGSCLASDAALRGYLGRLFQEKGAKRGYAIAMHLRDALSSLWGDDAGAIVTRHVRDIQLRVEVTLKSEWDTVRGAVAHLPAAWRTPFNDFVTRCETDPPDDVLSPFTLQGMAEALSSWTRFRRGDTSRPLTGADLNDYAVHLAASGVWVSAVRSAVTKVYMCYTHILTPGFRSGACQAVLRDLKGRAETAGPCRKNPAQIVPATLLYKTGQEMMAEAQAGSSHDMQAATLYRNGLLLTVAAALPLRRRALASLDLATSFRLEERPVIRIDIAGHYLKLRHAEKDYRRYRAQLTSQVVWDAVDVWRKRFRPMFDDGTALWPSMRVRGEALVADVLGQVFGETTAERIGVWVPIHRVRDCAATECIEELEHGAGWAQHLLNHRSAQTATQFYDHSTGVAVSREFGQLVAARRSDPVDLIL
jgi:integrase